MSCCCINTLNICKTPVCGTLELDQLADAAESGIENLYSLVLDFLGTQVTIQKLQVEGENISFDIEMLNENFEYTGNLYNSAGDKINILVGSEIYDCIKFKTVMNVLATL